MGSESELLGALLDVDPWVEEEDRGHCHFCESQEGTGRWWPDGSTFVALHFNDCPWVVAYLYMRDALPEGHAVYVPPVAEVCAECGYTHQLDDHANLVSYDRALSDKHWAHTSQASRFLQDHRPVADSLPSFTLPPGNLQFLPASHGVIKSVDGTVHVEAYDIQFSIPVEGEMWNLNAITLKWEDLT